MSEKEGAYYPGYWGSVLCLLIGAYDHRGADKEVVAIVAAPPPIVVNPTLLLTWLSGGVKG